MSHLETDGIVITPLGRVVMLVLDRDADRAHFDAPEIRASLSHDQMHRLVMRRGAQHADATVRRIAQVVTHHPRLLGAEVSAGWRMRQASDPEVRA